MMAGIHAFRPPARSAEMFRHIGQELEHGLWWLRQTTATNHREVSSLAIRYSKRHTIGLQCGFFEEVWRLHCPRTPCPRPWLPNLPEHLLLCLQRGVSCLQRSSRLARNAEMLREWHGRHRLPRHCERPSRSTRRQRFCFLPESPGRHRPQKRKRFIAFSQNETPSLVPEFGPKNKSEFALLCCSACNDALLDKTLCSCISAIHQLPQFHQFASD